MINIYNNIRDENDVFIKGRTFLFISNNDIDEQGNINTPTFGLGFSPETSGNLFIVDEWLIEQLDKVQFKDGTLSVKEGMEVELPVKTEKEKIIEEMERQLAALKAEPDKPTDIGENAEPPVEVPTDTEENKESQPSE